MPRERDIIPIENIPSKVVNFDVYSTLEASMTTPLREIIGHAVFQEGEALVAAYEPTPEFIEEIRHDPAYEVRHSFRQVGEYMLYSCALARDGIGAAEEFVENLRDRASTVYPYNPDEGITIQVSANSVERFAPGALREANASFAIDPTGFDLLDKTLAVDKDSAKSWPTPLMIARAEGFAAGVQYYKDLYREAVKTGATPDSTANNRFHRLILRARRKIASIVDYPPRELYE